MTIAELIKTRREALGMTQEELAEKLEVSRQAVSKWETGLSVPGNDNRAALSELLGVTDWPEAEEAAREAGEYKEKLKRLSLAALTGWLLSGALLIGLAVLALSGKLGSGAAHMPTVTPTSPATVAPTMEPAPPPPPEASPALLEVTLFGEPAADIMLRPGGSARLTAQGTALEVVGEVQWLSADEKVAVVDDSGLVIAAGPGATHISALCGQLEAKVVVRVMEDKAGNDPPA